MGKGAYRVDKATKKFDHLPNVMRPEPHDELSVLSHEPRGGDLSSREGPDRNVHQRLSELLRLGSDDRVDLRKEEEAIELLLHRGRTRLSEMGTSPKRALR